MTGDRHSLPDLRQVTGEALAEAARSTVVRLAADLPVGGFDVTVDGTRGRLLLTPGRDESWIATGVEQAYEQLGSRTLLASPTDSGAEVPWTAPVSISLHAGSADDDPYAYELAIRLQQDTARRGYLFQETKATLNPQAWDSFLRRVLPSVLDEHPGCTRLAVVAGGTSAEQCLASAAWASVGWLDQLPGAGDGLGSSLRDVMLEVELTSLARELGALTVDSVRVVRQVRHGGSLPVAVHVGLSTDRWARTVVLPGPPRA